MKQNKNFKEWIIFENEDYLAINKPPYVATLEDRASPISVLKLAREYNSELRVCHRLDKETSGILLLAKSQDAYRNAALQFSDRQVNKTYHAVANGIHEFKNKTIELDLSVSSSGVVRVKKGAKPSTTIVNTIEKYRHHSLLECKPVTGRTHQIRVHLAAVNAALVADAVYGGDDLFLSSLKKNYVSKTETEERPLMPRVALHAYSLSFLDMTGKDIMIECPYPKDIRTIITQLRKFS